MHPSYVQAKLLDLEAVDLVLHIDVPDEVIADRMVNRRVHEARHVAQMPIVLVPVACTLAHSPPFCFPGTHATPPLVAECTI